MLTLKTIRSKYGAVVGALVLLMVYLLAARDKVQKTIAMKGDSKIYIAVSKVEFCNEGRLGNKMFQAAAGLSIAHKNNATFALVKDEGSCHWTATFLELFSGLESYEVISSQTMAHWNIIEQSPHMRYENYSSISISTNISGYFQNFKYITDAETIIRSAFKFSEKYTQHARNTIKSLKRKFEHMISSPYLVGIHIRLGDILEPRLVEYGYRATNRTFYEQSMRIMADKYDINKLLFVVSSDNITRAKAMLEPLHEHYHITYLDEGGTANEDFAVLSSMDHMITSGGTFGFWAAWRVPGDVIYFSEYAYPASPLAQLGYCRECFNFPQWVPVGNSLPKCECPMLRV